ncbi:Armadillo-like helical [Penicillium verhagenii]|uniref:Armadillo-like helical n=1 Tax=Penicillium verhagenii TaxID=1562060 RepID=UPI00254515F2|nr:Armadillo-like helical [Penicillium verhagenii]KAJ5935095.1 Armadillo-like helical [Penicillium verhagenii]
MEAIAQNIAILSEKTLRDIAKGPLIKFTQTCDDQEQVSRVWQSLSKTLSSPSLDHLHTTAACNAASAFLDAAVNSPIKETKQLALSPEVWLAIFEVFMTRYEDVRPKPLKQLLASLTTILVKHYKGETRMMVQNAVLNSVLPCIILGEPRSRLKGSLVCLEMFIRKGAISPSELIPLVRSWLLQSQDQWVPFFKKDQNALYPGVSDPNVMSSEPSEEVAGRILVLGLLTQTNNRGMAGTSGNILAAFLQKLKAQSPNQQMSGIWIHPARHMLLQNLDSVEVLSIQIMEPIFSSDPEGFPLFLETLPLRSLMVGDMTEGSQSEYMLLFVSLQVGKKVNLVHDDYDASKKASPNNVVLKSEVIGNFLLHRDPTIRVAALSLLITAFSTVKPFTKAATTAILGGLPSMHADSDAFSRGEIMGLTRKLIIRLKSGILSEGASEAPQTKTGSAPATSAEIDSETKAFLSKYVEFIESDLCVTASYPRHITALKALKLLLESGLDARTTPLLIKSEVQTRWNVHLEVFGSRLLRLLVDLLLDPFEEVRQTSLLIINLFPSDFLIGGLSDDADQQIPTGMRLTDALARAESLASKTSRADHADTVARLYHIFFSAAPSNAASETSNDWWATKYSVVNTILSRLEERLSSPKGLFNSAMQQAPLHGYMSGLRYIILVPEFYSLISVDSSPSTWKSTHDRIVSICDSVWQEVKPVLCIDSPEGHTDQPTEDFSVGPKDILSYSWRALRESSLLLHATMTNLTYGPVGDQGLQRPDFENVGRVSFTQLAELRHRGAFSTVSTTFATCCQRCTGSQDPSIQELPVLWYQEAKSTIFESAAKLTRRSAGLPALVTGVLCSSPGTPFFKQAFNELYEISRLPVDYDKDQQYLKLPQVHAMNCLKDIFVNNKLGPHTEAFIMPALTLSAERIGSPIWNLRNSGLMLFRALLTRMCRFVLGTGAGFGGISGSEPGSKISFPKYPGLLELLSSLLAPTAGTTVEGTDIVTERIFPALELIGEKIPTFDEDDTMLRGLVIEHFNSPVWAIREHAARVYASLLTRANILQDVCDLVSLLKGNITENYLHGTVLCVQYSLRRFAASTDVFWTSQLEELLITVRHILATVFPMAKSPFVATALVEILNDTLERSVQADVEERTVSFITNVFEEHDLDGVLGYVFDASKAGWNLESGTRASSLFRRVLTWCKILSTFTSRDWSTIPFFFHGVAAFDADAANWIVERLQETVGEKEIYHKPLADLCSSVILGDYTSDVKTVAVSNLASILEHLLGSKVKSIAELAVPCDELIQSFRPDQAIQEWNRQATDAELRLQGCLLAIRVISGGDQLLSASQSTLRSWAIKLRSALSEETEFTTRYAAMESIKSFSLGLRPADCSPRVDDVLLDIYLILYDMLNDDDEELRDIAASTASWVLSYSSVSPRTAVALGPLNASLLLATFVTNHYSGSPQLAKRVIRYLTGQSHRISGSDEQTHLVSVADLVNEYCQESTVLFVEEKQNLFIDDVREIDVWSKALLHLRNDAYPEILVRQFSSWVSEGLEYLSKKVTQETGQDGLLGWISKPESFTLGVRIISISTALASEKFTAPQYLNLEPGKFQQQLQLLLDAGRGASVHDEWLSRISSGVKLTV